MFADLLCPVSSHGQRVRKSVGGACGAPLRRGSLPGAKLIAAHNAMMPPEALEALFLDCPNLYADVKFTHSKSLYLGSQTYTSSAIWTFGSTNVGPHPWNVFPNATYSGQTGRWERASLSMTLQGTLPLSAGSSARSGRMCNSYSWSATRGGFLELTRVGNGIALVCCSALRCNPAFDDPKRSIGNVRRGSGCAGRR